MAEAFPLHWPAGWPRTPARERKDGRSKFSRQDWRTGGSKPLSVAVARDQMIEELRMLGADPGRTVISSDVPLRNDGLPRSGWNPDDPGVAVYFVLDGEATVMARDAFTGVAENLRSLTLAIAALRQLHRHGGGVMLKRAFAGFSALPPPDGSTVAAPSPWYEVLGVPSDAHRDECRAAYRALAKALHPDNPQTGDAKAFARLQSAWDGGEFVTMEIEGQTFVIVDIGLRMLSPREQFRAQGFPDSYVIDHDAEGRPFTKTTQVRCCGNSVCPPVAEALVKANVTLREIAADTPQEGPLFAVAAE